MSGGEERYRAALEGRGLRDVRPLYRQLLKRLREEDAEAYREGVRRYEEELAPAMEGADEPLREWLRYGAWLAARIAPGSVTAVDRTGRATDLEQLAPDAGGGDGAEVEARQLGLEAAAGTAPDDPGGDTEEEIPEGALILHLPDRDREPGITLARPSDPTEFQEAARELLCP